MEGQLSDTENFQLLHLSGDALANIRQAKTQQWIAGSYTFAAYGALIFSFNDIARSVSVVHVPQGLLSILWSVFVVFVGIGGTFVVWNLQFWMDQQGHVAVEVEKKLSTKYQEIAGRTSSCYRRAQVWLISGIVLGGAAIAVFMIAVGPPKL